MIKFGEPLLSPITQSFLPVIVGSNNLMGVITITSAVYPLGFKTGTYTNKPVTTVTLDASEPVDRAPTFNQYVAVHYDYVINDYQPWADANFLNTQELGIYEQWSMPTGIVRLAQSEGVFLTSLMTGQMNPTVSTQPPTPAPSASPASISWNASVKWLYSPQSSYVNFADFNWIIAFNAKSNSTDAPVRIQFVSSTYYNGTTNVANSDIVAKVIGNPNYVGAGGVQFDTVRLIRVNDKLATGAYTFNFLVTNTSGKSVSAVLTLTVN